MLYIFSEKVQKKEMQVHFKNMSMKCKCLRVCLIVVFQKFHVRFEKIGEKQRVKKF